MNFQTRHFIILIASLLLISGAMSAISAATSIACVGNSITAGSKLADTTARYPSLLLKMLGTTYLANSITNPSSPVTIRNAGLSGRTLLKKSTQPYWVESAFSQLFSLKPNIITLMLGTNDTKPVNWTHYSSEFEPDYASMVDTFATISSQPKVIVCIPPPIFKVRTSAMDTTTHSDSTMVYGVIPKILNVAKTRGLPVIDARTPFLDKENLFPDSLHPDAQGHKIIADVFYEGILNYASNQLYQIKFLWYGSAPGIIGAGTDTLAKPMLHVYPPSANTNTHTAILICPGGGYDHIALKKEGDSVGQWLASKGVTAFVLRYRFKPYYYPIPFNDAKRAMRLVRYCADDYGIDTNKIGIMGFSAGGHLSSIVGTDFDNGNSSALDPIEKKKTRPDFMALIYPVITMTGPYVHTGSRDALLGTATTPSPALLDSMSTQKWVTPQTPQTFLSHGGADNSVPIQNSLMFDSACAANGVPHKHMVDPGMGHGYGLAGKWPDTLISWMRERGIITSTAVQPSRNFYPTYTELYSIRKTADNRLMVLFNDQTPSRINIYTVSGKRVAHFGRSTERFYSWRPTTNGVYLLTLSPNGQDVRAYRLHCAF
jgi:acetyl esterase/lipase/lysophospholipase L1-like esterase